MSSAVKVLGAFVDTLVLNIYQTRADFQVIKGRLESELLEKLKALKEKAQDDEEPAVPRFVFCGALMDCFQETTPDEISGDRP